LPIGGDPRAQLAFWVGAIVLSACNIGLVYLHSKPERYDELLAGWLWVISTTGAQPAVLYFGPFSAVVMVDILGIVFIALGRRRSIALLTTCVCIGGHMAIAIPIILGVMPDRGVLSSAGTTASQLWIAEALIFGFLVSSY